MNAQKQEIKMLECTSFLNEMNIKLVYFTHWVNWCNELDIIH